jgi:hypothetical protein
LCRQVSHELLLTSSPALPFFSVAVSASTLLLLDRDLPPVALLPLRRGDVVSNAVVLPLVAQLLSDNTSLVALPAVAALTPAPVAVPSVVAAAAGGA